MIRQYLQRFNINNSLNSIKFTNSEDQVKLHRIRLLSKLLQKWYQLTYKNPSHLLQNKSKVTEVISQKQKALEQRRLKLKFKDKNHKQTF